MARSGAITYATAMAFYGVGSLTPNPVFGSVQHFANIAGHAAVGCASTAAQGGSCGSGALAAAFGAAVAPQLVGLNRVSGTIASAVAGGIGSVLGGGKFANGAVTGAFGYLFNAAAHERRLAALEADLKNPNVQAFLSTIAQAEGATYNTAYGGGTFDDFSTFPGYGNDNTASGRYQILAGTYDYLSGKLGLTDFSPHTQDLMAAQLLNESGAMKFIRAGNLDAALSGASRHWASLPRGPNLPSRYNQPYMPYDRVRSTFELNRSP